MSSFPVWQPVSVGTHQFQAGLSPDMSICVSQVGWDPRFRELGTAGIRITPPDILCFKRTTVYTLQATSLTKATSETELWEVNTRTADLF